jgi:hypothetical protein
LKAETHKRRNLADSVRPPSGTNPPVTITYTS